MLHMENFIYQRNSESIANPTQHTRQRAFLYLGQCCELRSVDELGDVGLAVILEGKGPALP